MSWYQEHKKTTWLSVSGVAAVLIAAGIFYFFHFHEQANKASAQGDGSKSTKQQQAAPMRVKVTYPKEGGVERLVRRPATVQAFEFADLYAKVSGYLRNQKVDIGWRVKADDVLAEVYAPEKYKDVEKAGADRRKAEANVNAAKAQLNRAEADQKAAQSRYEQSKSDVKKAQAMVSLRRKQYKRYRGLAEDKAIQLELVDEKMEAQLVAEAAETAAEKAVTTAYDQLEAAKADVVQAKANIEDAKAALGVAQAALDRAEVFAKYTQIVSPYTGVVTKRNFHNGDFIRDASREGEKPVLAVARTDKMRIIVQVPDTAVPYLKVDDPVTLRIDTLPDRHFKGKVARMAYQESYDTRTMRTEVDLENPDGLLKDGMYGEMTIHLGREKGLRIPSKCLTGNEKGNERAVYVVREGKAKEVKVEIGIDDGIEVTIRKGVKQGDQVVVDRPSGMTDNSPVEVLHERAADSDKKEEASSSDKREKMPASDNDKSRQKKQKQK